MTVSPAAMNADISSTSKMPGNASSPMRGFPAGGSTICVMPLPAMPSTAGRDCPSSARCWDIRRPPPPSVMPMWPTILSPWPPKKRPPDTERPERRQDTAVPQGDGIEKGGLSCTKIWCILLSGNQHDMDRHYSEQGPKGHRQVAGTGKANAGPADDGNGRPGPRQRQLAQLRQAGPRPSSLPPEKRPSDLCGRLGRIAGRHQAHRGNLCGNTRTRALLTP